MGMQVEVDGGKVVTLGDGDDAEAMLRDATGMGEVAADIARGSWFSRYHAEQDMDPRTARKIAKALFEGGREGADEFIEEMFEDAEDADSAYDEMMDGDEAYRQPHVRALVDAIAEATGQDEDEVRDALVERLREETCDAIADGDKSKPVDIVPDHVRVEVVHYFGLGDLGVDDRMMNHQSNVFEVGTVEPDDRLAALFEGLGIGFEGFRAHFKAETGIDLKGGPEDAGLVAWLAGCDYLGGRDYARERALERAAAWAGFDPKVAEGVEPVLSNADLMTVMSESSYGGLPCYVARVPLKQLMERDWDLPARFDPDRSYGVKSGGFAGIFQPANGSGFIERVSGPVTVPPGLDGWRVSGETTMDVDKTFGIVGTYYYANVTDLPAPAPKVEEPVEAEESPSFGM